MVRPAWWMKILLPGIFWRGDKSRKVVYLTFDDGPIPEITPWVVELLKSKGIKATFFCVGENVAKHPLVYQMLADQGHVTGNHTFHHIPAWRIPFKQYLHEIDLAATHIHSPLFRPPHGKLYPWHLRTLKQQFQQIVMWDVLTKDYDQNLTPENVLNHVIQYVRPGSVIVFHDSLKAWPRLQVALPLALDWLIAQGYDFETIPVNANAPLL